MLEYMNSARSRRLLENIGTVSTTALQGKSY